jgi:hypothetical protein
VITGDFFITPVDAIRMLEQKLQGIELNDTSVSKVVLVTFSSMKVNTSRMPKEDFIEAILKLRP